MKAFDVVLADSGIASLLINSALSSDLKTLILQERGNSEVDLRVWEFRAADLQLLRERWPALCSAVLSAGQTGVTVQRCDAQGAVKSVQLSTSTVKHSLPSRVWVSSQDLLSALKATTDWTQTTWVHHGGPLSVSHAHPAPPASAAPAAPTRTSRMAQLRSRLISAADPHSAPAPSVPCHPILTSLLSDPASRRAEAARTSAARTSAARPLPGAPSHLKITISQVQVANLLPRPAPNDPSPSALTPAGGAAQPRGTAPAQGADAGTHDTQACASEPPFASESTRASEAGVGGADAAAEATGEAGEAVGGGLRRQEGGSLEGLREHLARCLGATTAPPAPGPDCYVYGNLVVADMVPTSQVRRSIIGDAGPTFGGRVMWRGVTQLPTDAVSDKAFQTAFQPGLTIWEDHASGDRQLQVFAFPNGTCHWSMSVPWTESAHCLDGMPPTPGADLASHSLDHAHAPPCPHTLRMLRCLNAAASFGPAAQLLIRTTLPDRVQERPLLLREAPAPTASCPDNVALLLDAAVPDLAAHSGVVALAAPLLSEVAILLTSLDASPVPALAGRAARGERNPLARLAGREAPAALALPRSGLRRSKGCDADLAAVRVKRSRQATTFLQRCRGEEPASLVARPQVNALRGPVDSILRRLRTRPGGTPPVARMTRACARPVRAF